MKLLQDNLLWLSKKSELPYDLNIDKYRQNQKQRIATNNQNDSLLKIKKEMKVETMEVDKDKYFNNPDQTKNEYYKAWLSILKNDMYVDESTKVLSDLVHTTPAQMVLNKGK